MPSGGIPKRRACGLEHVVKLREVLHRLEELPQIKDEGGQHAQRELALHHEEAAEQQDRGGCQTAQQVDRRAEG